MALTGAGWREVPAPSAEDFDALVEAAFAALPGWVRDAAGGVMVRIEDFAPEEVLDDMGVEDPFELTGLYDGVALTEKSMEDLPGPPDTVWLFRRPILEEWIDRGDVALGALVAHVLVHELAHHFGWSDDDIAAIDPWWE
ncbi:MAG: metallopeptidase family protein [Pseudomonadota bacterium]